MKLVIENSMLVDSDLTQYLKDNEIVIDKEFSGLKWKSEDEIKQMISFILSGEKKDIFLATSYMEPEFISEIFAAINKNVSSISVFIYDSQAETIIISYSRKYPEIKFTLLNNHL